MKRAMLFFAMSAIAAMVVAVPAALGQAPSAVIENGVAKANAGGTEATAGCPAVPPTAKAGDVLAQAECKPPPPPPPAPKAAPAPPPAPAPAPPPPAPKAAAAPPPAAPAPPPPPAPKMLPPSGGISYSAFAALGAGVLLLGGGLLTRRFIR